MIGDKIIEINAFELRYDGVFKLRFNLLGRMHLEPIFLNPMMLSKIIENEGVKFANEEFEMYNFVKFTQTTIQVEVFENDNGTYSFLTSEAGECYQDYDIYLIDVKIKD